MARRVVPLRRIGVAGVLAGASVLLHVLLFAGLAGRLEGSSPPMRARTVEVALLAPVAPPAPTPVAVEAAPAAPAPAPAATPPRAAAKSVPRDRQRPRSAPVAPVRPAQPPAAVSADEWGSVSEAPALEPAQQSTEAPPDATAVASATSRQAGPAAEPVVERADSEPVPASEPQAAAGPAPMESSDEAVSGGDGAPLPSLPASVTQGFRVYWGDYADSRSVARLQYRLERNEDRYAIRTEGEAEGLISLVYSGTLAQVSEGRVGPRGLEPSRYAEQRGRRSERTIRLDAAGHRMYPVDGSGPVSAPTGTQDRLSVFYQLGLLARAHPEQFVAGAVRELPVATMREVRIERFNVVGDEMLMLPGGALRALHLRRPAPEGTSDPLIDLWLGYDFEMLPIRLRIEDAGQRVLDQVIDRGG